MRCALRFALVCAIGCLFSLSAFADDINVIFDPPATTPPTASLYVISEAGVTYSVSWGSCSQAGVPVSMSSDEACLLFINETGSPIDDLNITFTAGTADEGYGTVSCTSLDSTLSSNNCPSGAISSGELVTLSFFGGDAVPDLGGFFIAENGVDPANLGAWDIEVPEPGTLVLLMFGLAAVFAFGYRRQQALNIC